MPPPPPHVAQPPCCFLTSGSTSEYKSALLLLEEVRSAQTVVLAHKIYVRRLTEELCHGREEGVLLGPKTLTDGGPQPRNYPTYLSSHLVFYNVIRYIYA